MKEKLRIKFLYEMSSLLECGIVLRDVGDFLSPEFKNEKEKLTKSLEEGLSLKEVFLNLSCFKNDEMELISIAEETGGIDKILIAIHDGAVKEKELKNKLISFLIYPLFMLVMMVAYSIFSLFFLVPLMKDLLKALDVKEGLLFTLDEIRVFILNNSFTILPILLLILLIIIKLGINYSIHHRIVLGKKYFQFKESQIIRSVERLMSSGKNIVDSIELTGDSKNFNKKRIREVLEEGDPLWKALESGGFSKDLTSVIRINEEGGNVLKGLRIYLQKTDKEMKAVMEKRIKLLEPITLILTGALMAVTLVSVMGPLMEGMGKIRWNKRGFY